ncbi:aconitate hydratase AcnA [Companilactobacillus jidongensis]|uniref:aconitate hydratase AcnA n=1 Tax=Companilactobacillus jidongensis TaxID=2486006 RepID=UPI000F7A15E2|nr:aconitate hydratase AcnA [Companilactobacillus jidongensis]
MATNDNVQMLNGVNYLDLNKITNEAGVDIETFPYTIRVLLENVARHANGGINDPNVQRVLHWRENIGQSIAFYPARIILQDYTGVPCVVDLASMREAAKKMNIDPESVNPEIPVDLVVDHSVQVDKAGNPYAMAYNIKREYERNSERYKLLKWAQKSFDNFKAIPPDTGIIHQINIEHISPVVQNDEKKNVFYPDTVFGTDSHTTMINGLGVLGWGVGGLEAEACMLGEPSIFSVPEVIGVRLTGKLPSGVVATDLALTITNLLRQHDVVGKFVEYFGPGYQNLGVADRATLGNMSPEYGSTCGFSPFDEESVKYLKLTGRSEDIIKRAIDYNKLNSLFYKSENADEIKYTKVIDFDLSTVSTSLAGPKRPQDIIGLGEMSKSFDEEVTAPLGNHGFGMKSDDLKAEAEIELNGKKEVLRTGDIMIAALTSCTNTSNPTVLIGAGLLAKRAVEHGLTISPKVKTSFAPGSQAVTKYLTATGLMPYLEKLGFNIIAYGCTTCIGNSGPLPDSIEASLKKTGMATAAILSGNRNFESRIHPLIKGNYLASPILVIAYALAGNMRVNLQTQPLGIGTDGKPVYLKDIWPTTEEIDTYSKKYIVSDTYREAYKDIFDGREEWNNLDVNESETYDWDPKSTYIANPPYFDEQVAGDMKRPELSNLSVLAKVADSVTTDHISPAGMIQIDSPAGKYLEAHNISVREFNSYGSRRGNHHVMVRGTLANTQLHNQLSNGKQGGYTNYLPDNKVMTIYEACKKYKENNTGLIILAGKDYGMGSSRDWAAKGVKLLGVRAVIAESFERIHRSNLAMMGVVPLQYKDGENAETFKLDGTEKYDIELPDELKPDQDITVDIHYTDGHTEKVLTTLRLDSDAEISYLGVGGILNKVLEEKK